jgi:hypothetical protein
MIGTGDPGFRRDLLEALLQSLPPEIGKSGRAAQERKEFGHDPSEKESGKNPRENGEEKGLYVARLAGAIARLPFCR